MDDIISNMDLAAVDLSRPLLSNQTLICTIGEVRVEEKNDKRRLVIPLTLEQEGKDTKGNPVHVGFQVTHSVLITPTGGLTQERINEEVARFQVAALALDKPKNGVPLSEYAGKRVVVTFDTRVDKNDAAKIYQDVKRFKAVPAGAATATAPAAGASANVSY